MNVNACVLLFPKNVTLTLQIPQRNFAFECLQKLFIFLELQRDFDSTTYPMKTYQYLEVADLETESARGHAASHSTLTPNFANSDQRQRSVDDARYHFLISKLSELD